ncbi:protein SCO1/2 [Neorhizobium huautlense]|uniref:Protein SCO1/2 n=1 Tax=Neorhizobium huautlense TaxID=67774 RepID=A0ABT9PTN3_9HYPH|nr:SCO family protein [Neorhizobium huautlense]MDP9837811.1 protein SCO1/2 [Neorhizobium huautlense]
MAPKNPFMMVAGVVSGLFVLALVGVMVWMTSATPRAGGFNANFSLVNDRGEEVDQSLFKGSPSLVYFGYTHCPEVCPTTLLEVTSYLKELGDAGSPLKTYFFTVDPERDTPEIMRGYVTAFSDRITGVTGAPEEMQKVISGWRAFARKQPNKSGGYSMSHTMDLFLIGADGRLKGLIPYGADQDEAVEKIRAVLPQA